MNAPYVYIFINTSSDGEEINKDLMQSDDFNQTGLHLVIEQPVEETIITINPLDDLHADKQQLENLLNRGFLSEESVAKSGKVILSIRCEDLMRYLQCPQ